MYLTHRLFTTLLEECLQEAGISSKGYTCNIHNFQIRVATTADRGISDAHIKMLGRWKSNAYQLHVCVHTLQEQLAKL